MLDCRAFKTLGWHHKSLLATRYVYFLLYFCIWALGHHMLPLYRHWVGFCPPVKLQNGYVDWKISPKPPSTQCLVENWCNSSSINSKWQWMEYLRKKGIIMPYWVVLIRQSQTNVLSYVSCIILKCKVHLGMWVWHGKTFRIGTLNSFACTPETKRYSLAEAQEAATTCQRMTRMRTGWSDRTETARTEDISAKRNWQLWKKENNKKSDTHSAWCYVIVPTFFFFWNTNPMLKMNPSWEKTKEGCEWKREVGKRFHKSPGVLIREDWATADPLADGWSVAFMSVHKNTW